MIGSYKVTRLLGRGGMGHVFEAIHLNIGRRAAIKVLAPELSQDPQVAMRFLNEARAANLVRHPGLVEIFEFGKLDDGTAFIIMDYLDGETLSSLLNRRDIVLDRRNALDIVRQIAAAIAAAHERGIVHRDLKPDNVMLVSDVERPGRLRVKVLDFGIAKVAAQPEAGLANAQTHPGTALGTPAYMSPEQCLGLTHIDGQADVYSLGIILFELLSGHRPFDAQLSMDVMTMHVRRAPPTLGSAAGSEAIELLVAQMLAKVPGERPKMTRVAETLAQASIDTAPPFVIAQPTAPYSTDKAIPTAEAIHTPGNEPLDPFTAGPPITDPRHFFGRQREIKRLFNLWKRTPLQNAAIIGPTRSGKTSLLYYLRSVLHSSRLRTDQRNDLVSDPGRYRFVFVDFQDPRMGSQEYILRHLLQALSIPIPSHCDLESFISVTAEHLRSPTIMLFDEVSVALQRYRELDTTFWEGLRALAINQVGGNLGFVLSSTYPPHELAKTQDGGGSPFFNIFGYSATLGPLSPAESRQLIASSPIPFSEADIEWILEQSGGWPILVQILSRERFLSLLEDSSDDEWRTAAVEQMMPFRHLIKRGTG